MTQHADPRLGDHLRMTRARHWVLAAGGDPYALVLRDLADDPRPLYAAVRDRGPVHRSQLGTWVVADAGLGAEVLGDTRLGVRSPDGAEPEQHVLALPMAFPDRDTAAPLDPSTADIEELALRAAERLPDEFDLLADFARPLSVRVLATLYDVDTEQLTACVPGLATALDARLCPQTLDRATALLVAVDALEKLNAELLPVVVAATEPATTLLANAVLDLLARPAGLAAPREDTEHAQAAVERVLRTAPPTRLLGRVAREDVELAGHRVQAGDHVVVLGVVGDGASLDPAPVPSLAFADPLDFAAAAPLVLAFATSALRALAARRPGLRLTGPAVPRRRSPVVRGLHGVPVVAAQHSGKGD